MSEYEDNVDPMSEYEDNVDPSEILSYSLWEKLLWILSESRRREMQIAELIIRGPKIILKNKIPAISDATKESKDNTEDDSDKLKDELEFIKKKWEIRTNCKL